MKTITFNNIRIFLLFSLLYGAVVWLLLGTGDEIFRELHFGLDASIGILAFLLALFLWGNLRSFPNREGLYLALSFGITSIAQLVHTLAGVEWSSITSLISTYPDYVRPATWPPQTYVLPIGLAWSLWLLRRHSALQMRSFTLGMCVISLVLYVLAFSLPRYVDTGFLGIQRPTQVPLLFLWSGIVYAAWHERRRHPLYEGLALMGAFMVLPNLFNSYSPSPHEKFSMIGHAGILLAYTMLHIMLMRIASDHAIALDRTEEALKEQGKKLRAIFEGSNDAIVLMGKNGFIDCNARTLRMFGLKRKRDFLAHRPIDFSPPVQPDGRDSESAGNEHMQFALRQGVNRFEWLHRREDGETFPAEILLSGFEYGGERIVQATVRDISRRKQNEAHIERMTHLYHALSEINQSIVRMSDEAQLFPLVCRMAVDFGRMKMAWIGLVKPGSDLIEPVARYGNGVEYLDGIVISSCADEPEGCGPTGTAYRENRSVIVNNFTLNHLTAPWHVRALPFHFMSSAAFPVLRADKPYAVFTVYSEQKDAFDPDVIALLEEMARDISQALDRMDSERQALESRERLRESEERWKFAVEAAGGGMWDLNFETRTCFLSIRWIELTGTTEEELGMSFDKWANLPHPIDVITRYVYPDDVPGVLEKFQAYIDSATPPAPGSNASEFRILCKDGSTKWLLIRGMVIDRTADGKPRRMIGIFSDITSRKQAEAHILRLAHFDPLTNLPNRTLFLDRMEQEAKKSDRSHAPLALLLIDLDQFKEVNDTLGHDIGDILLQEAGRRIRTCVRESDTVARLGGDEFTVILPELHDDTGRIEAIAQKIITSLAEPFHLGNETTYISASIGITLYPTDATSIDALMKNADQAMYAAKNKGRNRFSYFTPVLQEAAQNRLRLSNDLRGALAARQFRVHFQPIVELASGRIHKAEALIRWEHPVRGMVNPKEFIPLCEETGLIHDIGDWVFKEAAYCAKRWGNAFSKDFQVSVNMSPAQFRAEGPAFAVVWLLHMQQLGLSGRNIVVEITEGLLLNAEPDILKKLLIFRDAGIQVAIDDFGTGYSSLSYLKKFDIDYLKIDQSFVHGLETDPNDLALCEAIIVMAHKLGLKVIAEGVETEGQRKVLSAAGCDYAQGYLFAKPAPAEEIEKLLK